MKLFESQLDNFWKRVTELTTHNEQDLENYDGGLFHYTDSKGLLGILQNQNLWATESMYLSDSTEVTHGLELTEKLLTLKLDQRNSKEALSVLSNIQEKIYDHIDQIYVTCFSEEGDLLSQWKGYGASGLGFSIEFNPKELFRTKRKFPFVNIEIKKVIYDLQQQQSMINAELDYAISNAEMLCGKYPNDELAIVQTISSATAYYLRACILRFKNEVFAEEKEWRAIYRNTQLSEEGNQIAKFRTSRSDLIPYLELDISASAGKRTWNLPIRKIIVGSKQNFERIFKSIHIIRVNKHMGRIRVTKSKIPLQ